MKINKEGMPEKTSPIEDGLIMEKVYPTRTRASTPWGSKRLVVPLVLKKDHGGGVRSFRN